MVEGICKLREAMEVGVRARALKVCWHVVTRQKSVEWWCFCDDHNGLMTIFSSACLRLSTDLFYGTERREQFPGLAVSWTHRCLSQECLTFTPFPVRL